MSWNNSAQGPCIALSDMEHSLQKAKPVSYFQEWFNKNNTFFFFLGRKTEPKQLFEISANSDVSSPGKLL